MLEQFDLDSFEPLFIKGIISDVSVLSNLSNFLQNPKLVFKNKDFALLVSFYKFFFDKREKLPTKDELALFLNKEEYKTAISRALSIVDDVDFEALDKDLFYSSAERFLKERGIWNTMISVATEMEKGTISPTDVLAQFEKICTISLDNDRGLDLYEDIDKVVSSLKEQQSVLSTGYKSIDKNIDGGLYANGRALYMFMAPPNKGKSLFLGNIACNLADQGKTALLISLEMSELAYASRFCAQQTAIPFAQLHLRVDEIKPLVKNKPGKIIIKEFPPSTITVPQLKAWIKRHIVEKGIKIDAIIIDYLNLFDGPGSGLYEKIKSITEQTRALSYQFEVPVISATQQNRCLTGDTVLEKINGEKILIKDVEVGDELKSNIKPVKVLHKFPATKQQVFLIETQSGKTIKCSRNHVFPTITGEKSMNTGLTIGDKLYSQEDTIIEDEITRITSLGEETTYDIEVSGNHLFFANGILTHNSATGKEMAGLTSVSESMGCAATADVMFEIFQNDEDLVTNYFRVGFSKNRYGPVNFSIITKVDFETLRIHDLEEEGDYTSTLASSIEDSLDIFLEKTP